MLDLSDLPFISQWPAGAYPGSFTITGPPRSDQAGIAERLLQEAFEDFGPSDFELALHEATGGLADLLARKQADYGPHAINGAPGGPLNGINVRLHDKLSRVVNLYAAEGDPAVVEEKLADTYIDIAGYAIIALLVLNGQWPS